MSANTEHKPRSGGRHNAALLFGMFGGALAWSAHLAVAYFLVQFLCGTNYLWLLYLVTAATLAIAAWALALSWRGYQHGHESDGARSDGFRSRVRFMGLYGVLANLLFIFGIIMGTLPVLVLDGCGG